MRITNKDVIYCLKSSMGINGFNCSSCKYKDLHEDCYSSCTRKAIDIVENAEVKENEIKVLDRI